MRAFSVCMLRWRMLYRTVREQILQRFDEVDVLDVGVHEAATGLHAVVGMCTKHVHTLEAITDARLDACRQIGYQRVDGRSEEHTSELQSRENLVCRLLLEKKNTEWLRMWP